MAKSSKGIGTDLTARPSEVSSLLEFLFKSDDTKNNVLLVGGPGEGKTSLVEQAAEKLGYDILISHPVVSDPTDAKGLPFVVNKDGESLAEWLPFGDLKKMMDTQKPLIVFLDDLGQAPPVVQAAYMQLLLARAINQHAVSDHVRFVAATNRKSDKAGVSGVLEPVKSRFRVIIHLETNYKDWTSWAIENGMPAELVAFINWRPDLLNQFEPTAEIVNTPCPRTVANVGYLMNLGLDEGHEHIAFSGAAGQPWAAEFLGFLRIYRDLPDPHLVLADPDKAKMPGEDKPEVKYALCAAIANIVEDKKEVVDNFVKFLYRLEAPEFAAMTVSLAKHKLPNIRNNKQVLKWLSDNREMVV